MRSARYRGLNPEGDGEDGAEAEFVLDAHAELLELVDRLTA
jgi:hypothetical protein